MARRRRAVAIGLASALVLSVGLFAQADKKTEDALKKDAQALAKLADAALVAQGGANDFNMTWVKEDFLKGPKDKEFVPFTFTLDPTKVTTENLDSVLACRPDTDCRGRRRRVQEKRQAAR